MAEFNIAVDLSGVLEALQAQIDDALFPKVGQAVAAIAAQAQVDWKDGILHAKLWSGEKLAYANSVEMKMTGPYSAVVWSDYKQASEIETGRPARDLKKMLDTSLKVRRAKDGHRYLIIPFRHNAPGHSALARPMPVDIHKMVAADSFAKSKVAGMGTRHSGTGAMGIQSRKLLTVAQANYQWGSRLPGGMTPKLHASHRNAPTDGMVRMQSKSGEKNGSVYLTFRVMSENATNRWIVPAQPGQMIVKAVVDRLQPLAEQIMGAAVAKDLKG